jgi:hypothetical protein
LGPRRFTWLWIVHTHFWFDLNGLGCFAIDLESAQAWTILLVWMKRKHSGFELPRPTKSYCKVCSGEWQRRKFQRLYKEFDDLNKRRTRKENPADKKKKVGSITILFIYLFIYLFYFLFLFFIFIFIFYFYFLFLFFIIILFLFFIFYFFLFIASLIWVDLAQWGSEVLDLPTLLGSRWPYNPLQAAFQGVRAHWE